MVHKPVYLKGLLHFDLSISERFDDEYLWHVKRLYGVEVYQKPELFHIFRMPFMKSQQIRLYQVYLSLQ